MPSQKGKGKVTKEVSQKRLREIQQCLRDGMSPADIRQKYTAEWDVCERHMYTFIKRAREANREESKEWASKHYGEVKARVLEEMWELFDKTPVVEEKRKILNDIDKITKGGDTTIIQDRRHPELKDYDNKELKQVLKSIKGGKIGE